MSIISKVGSLPNTKGSSLIFCNGAETSRDTAEKSAVLVSQALHNQVVTCFYNPTRLKSDPLFEDPNTLSVQELSKLLSEFLNEEIRLHLLSGCTRMAIRIALFLHSHSALIALHALDRLNAEDRDTIEVYTFGAVTMIPNNRAKYVVNYVHEHDLIAEGSSLVEKNPSLFHIKQIYEQEKLGVHRFFAIFKKAEHDLFLHLNPFRESYALEPSEIREDKDIRYRHIFTSPSGTGQSLMKDPFFQGRCTYYRSLFTDLNVVILPGIPRNPIEATTFEDFCNFSSKGIAANGFKNHLFPTYARTVFDGTFRSKF